MWSNINKNEQVMLARGLSKESWFFVQNKEHNACIE